MAGETQKLVDGIRRAIDILQQTLSSVGLQPSSSEQTADRSLEPESVVVLNVGGTRFSTTRETLMAEPTSFFNALVSSGNWAPDATTGEYFIDRDPKFVADILNYLRRGTLDGEVPTLLDVNTLSADDQKFFYEQVDFFGVESLRKPEQKEFRVLMLGLDGSGKTTLLYQWLTGEVVATIPTIGFNTEKICGTFGAPECGERQTVVELEIWDLGGQEAIRPYWRCYFARTKLLLWVVDAADKEKLGLAKQELAAALENEELAGVPVVVVVNKTDKPGCASVTELAEELGLLGLKGHTVDFKEISAKSGDGLPELRQYLLGLFK